MERGGGEDVSKVIFNCLLKLFNLSKMRKQSREKIKKLKGMKRIAESLKQIFVKQWVLFLILFLSWYYIYIIKVELKSRL